MDFVWWNFPSSPWCDSPLSPLKFVSRVNTLRDSIGDKVMGLQKEKGIRSQGDVFGNAKAKNQLGKIFLGSFMVSRVMTFWEFGEDHRNALHKCPHFVPRFVFCFSSNLPPSKSQLSLPRGSLGGIKSPLANHRCPALEIRLGASHFEIGGSCCMASPLPNLLPFLKLGYSLFFKKFWPLPSLFLCWPGDNSLIHYFLFLYIVVGGRFAVWALAANPQIQLLAHQPFPECWAMVCHPHCWQQGP